ncbi:hypothetical protein GCM10010421_46560 [Streptomyces glaucus]|uniref:Transposase n=1 Tax=Streptomyces glaucus TaxID=284029 RepID=A0ABN3K446_9ACTN
MFKKVCEAGSTRAFGTKTDAVVDTNSHCRSARERLYDYTQAIWQRVPLEAWNGHAAHPRGVG